MNLNTVDTPETVTPAAASFYITGGTLPAGAVSYVERQADTDLLNALLAGEYCYVLNSRQMGKSSLCVRTRGKLQQASVRTAFVDLTKFGGSNLSVEQWYAGILAEIGRELGLLKEFMAYWRAQAVEGAGPLRRLFGALEEVALAHADTPIVVFVDEIDATRSLPFNADEFFSAIRQLHEERVTNPTLERLTFCLLGTATPAELIQDTRISPFNIGERVEVTDFTPREAAPLAEGLGPNGVTLLERVLYWTNGHPYLTQQLCRGIAQARTQTLNSTTLPPAATPKTTGAILEARPAMPNPGRQTPNTESPTTFVDRLCADLFFTHAAKESDTNLTFVRARLLKSETEVAQAELAQARLTQEGAAESQPTEELDKAKSAQAEAARTKLMDFYGQVWAGKRVADDDTNPLCSTLKLSGIARVEKGLLRVRNRIYARVFDKPWIIKHTSDAELRRQEEAFRRKLRFKFALVSFVVFMTAALIGVGAVALTKDREEKRVEKEAQAARTEKKRALENEAKAIEAQHKADALLYIASMNLAQRELENQNVDYVRDILNREQRNSEAGFEWGYLQRQCDLSLATLTAQEYLTGMALSKDGKWLLTGGKDGTATLWNTKTHQSGRVFNTHKPVSAVALAPDGARSATGDSGGAITLWETDGQASLALTKQGQRVTALAYSPNGKWLADGGMDGNARLWDTASGKLLRAFPTQSSTIAALTFLPDGRHLLIGTDDGAAQIWDVASQSKSVTLRSANVRSNDTAELLCVAASPDGKWVAAGYGDKTARVFNAQTGVEAMPSQRLRHKSFVLCLAFSSDSKWLATGSGNSVVRIWDVVTRREQRRFPGHAGRIGGVAFSPDGGRVYAASADGLVKIWNVAQERQSLTLSGHAQSVRTLAFSPDSKWLVTGSDDNTARVWNAQTGKCAAILKGHTGPIEKVAFSADGRHIVTGSDDKTVWVWEAETGKRLFTLSRHDDLVFAVAYSPDGKYLAIARQNGALRLWEARAGNFARMLDTMTGDPTSLAFSPDSRSLLCGSTDNTAVLYDVESGKKRFVLKAHTDHVSSVAFSADGKRIATGSDDATAIVWDASTGKMERLLYNGVAVEGVAFSPDGKRLLTGDNDGHAHLWDTQRGQEVLMLNGHDSYVLCVAFSPDGKRIATGSADSTAKIWEGYSPHPPPAK